MSSRLDGFERRILALEGQVAELVAAAKTEQTGQPTAADKTALVKLAKEAEKPKSS